MVSSKHLQTDWRRTSGTAPVDPDSHQPLGDLARNFRKAMRDGLGDGSRTWAFNDRPRVYSVLNRLDVLWLLNDLNKRAGKHLTGNEILWVDVLSVHSGLY